MNQEINLPPLPPPGEAMSKWAYDESDMKSYASAAVEADRRAQMRDKIGCGSQSAESDRQASRTVPSDEELLKLAAECCDSTDATGEEPRFTNDESILRFARALLSRYSQPAASVEPVEADHAN